MGSMWMVTCVWGPKRSFSFCSMAVALPCVSLSVRWLFIKINILPKDENKKKKKKKKKKEKPKEEKEEKKDEKVKEPKDNMFVNFYHNNGV